MKRITRTAISPHSAAALYALVEDVESYPSFLPWCLAATVHERKPDRTRATLTVGLRGVRQSFTTQNENRAGEAIDMRLVEGPFKRSEERRVGKGWGCGWTPKDQKITH